MAALIPKARCVGLAASMLARRAPDDDVKASNVVAGERSARTSSVNRGRVGDREDDLECPRGSNRVVGGGKMNGGSMVLAPELSGVWTR